MFHSQPFDVGAYEKRSQEGPCFICELVAGANPHHMIYEDQAVVVFLSKYPVLYGYTLVAPREHREQATGDFTLDAYLALQRMIYMSLKPCARWSPPNGSTSCRLAASRAIGMCTGTSPRYLPASPMSGSKQRPLTSPGEFSRFRMTRWRHSPRLFARS